MGFNPAIERGIFLTKQSNEYGEHLVLVAALRNPSDEDVELRNMDTDLFKPSLKERTFTQEGTVQRWAPQTMSGQAVTGRVLKAGKTAVRKWQIPNAKEAHSKAVQTCSELDMLDSGDVRSWMRQYGAVEPDRLGVVQVRVGFPAPSNYFDTLTRQYDLRTNPSRKLDNDIPNGDEDAIDSMM